MRRNLLILTLLVVGILSLPILCYADIVHLKNGHKMEGTVIKETFNAFTLRMKFGTVGIPKENIEDIKRATSDENKAKKCGTTLPERLLLKNEFC